MIIQKLLRPLTPPTGWKCHNKFRKPHSSCRVTADLRPVVTIIITIVRGINITQLVSYNYCKQVEAEHSNDEESVDEIDEFLLLLRHRSLKMKTVMMVRVMKPVGLLLDF